MLKRKVLAVGTGGMVTTDAAVQYVCCAVFWHCNLELSTLHNASEIETGADAGANDRTAKVMYDVVVFINEIFPSTALLEMKTSGPVPEITSLFCMVKRDAYNEPDARYNMT